MVGRRGAGFWLGNTTERDNLEDLGVDGRIILKRTFNNCDLEALCGLFWLRIGTVGELL
jgi:hypothetical protein